MCGGVGSVCVGGERGMWALGMADDDEMLKCTLINSCLKILITFYQ